MATRISTGLRNFLNSGGSVKQAFNGGRMEIYSGTQPASSDSAATGTLLVTITDSSGALTAETRASGAVQLTGGASGSVSAVIVDGYNILDATVNFNTSLNQTASDLAAALNTSSLNIDLQATVATDTVTLTCKPGLGTKYNTMVVSATLTTITAAYTNFSGGVAAVNGLKFEDSAAGSMAKRSGQTWNGVVAVSGTMGWYRLYGPNTDAGTLDSTESTLRIDGSISTSGANLNFSSTAVTASATQTVGAYAVNVNAV
jgi:hypothetical protein